ncbi:MAG: hypothetical protein ACPLQP_12125, partial [Moorellaceae bacterium]
LKLRRTSRQNLNILSQLPASAIPGLGSAFAFGFIKFGCRESLLARFQAQAGLPCKNWGYTSAPGR